jgi:hypothetical protein
VCVRARARARTRACVHSCMCTHVCVYVCVCALVYAFVSVSVCVCVCVRMCAFSDANMCLKLHRPRVGSMRVLPQEIVASDMFDCSLVKIKIVRTPTPQRAVVNLRFTAKPRLVKKGVECLSWLGLGRELRSPKAILCENRETEFEAVDCRGKAQLCQYIVDGIDERL